MKKSIALIVCLCLICSHAVALSGTKKADGKPLKTKDFTLSLKKGEQYLAGQTTNGKSYALVYPYVVNGDESTDYLITGGTEYNSVTVETVNKNKDEFIKTMIRQTIELGYNVDSYERSDASAGKMCGEPCVIVKSEYVVSDDKKAVTLYYIDITFPNKGFNIRISSNSPKKCETVAEMLDTILVWR